MIFPQSFYGFSKSFMVIFVSELDFGSVTVVTSSHPGAQAQPLTACWLSGYAGDVRSDRFGEVALNRCRFQCRSL
jgi:hypothetical protein